MIEAPGSTTQELGSAAAQAEQGFLAAGQCLEEAVAILDRLTQRFGSYIGELTSTAVTETQRDLAAAGAHIAPLAEARRADAAALRALGDIVTAARHRIAALQPITQEVETLSLSARVVAGGMGAAAADFIVFAGDIRDAAQHARAFLSEACDALSRGDQDLTSARAEADAFVLRHGPAMQAIPTRLAGNLRSLAAQQQLATDAATSAHRQSEQVRQQVAEQIVALQLGDITRQRVEHVQAATQMSAEPQRQIGELLAAQLNDAADELLHEGARIEKGLRQLVQAAHAVGQLGIQVHGETKTGGFVVALEADIRETAALFDQLSAGDAETDGRMATLLEAADDLASRLASVQSVQEDIRIMGLNATLKCGRLGTIGRPLAAVAQELRLCSGRFGGHAASVLHDLDQLRSIASGLHDPSRRGRHAELAQTTDAMVAPVQRLGHLEHELATTLSELQNDADEVGRLVEAALSQFAVRHALAMTLRAAASEFASWTTAGSCAGEQLDRIAAIYTMARERDVHARFAPLPQETASADLADILF